MGWWSEGVSEEHCLEKMKLYKQNVKSGSGPQSPTEAREAERERREAEQAKREQAEKDAVTGSAFFDDTYFKQVERDKKPNTVRMERIMFNTWIRPAIGDVPLIQVTSAQIGDIKQAMQDAGRSAKTINLVLGQIRQIFNTAKLEGVFQGDPPTSTVKFPKLDNAKLRYLTPDEIDTLLDALRKKSAVVHDQAYLAVNCGLRFSEVAGLEWSDINFQTKTISIRDAKTGSRTVFMSADVAEILEARKIETDRKAKQDKGKDDETTKRERQSKLIFPDDNGKQQVRVSKTFQRVADELFNEGVTDRRLRVSFHTLRHTFGTHLYENTGDLYLAQKALGHRSLVMASRYAKMSEARLREAFSTVSSVLQGNKPKTAKIIKIG